MAATLFIIQIPKRKQEMALNGELEEDGEDDKSDIFPQENEKNNLENCPSRSVSSGDSDLQIDAQRVIEEIAPSSSLATLPKVSSSTNIETINNELNNNNSNTDEEETEITEALLVDKGKLKRSSSAGLVITIPKQNVNLINENNKDDEEDEEEGYPDHESVVVVEKEEAEITNPLEEMFEPCDPTSPEVTMLDFLTKEPLETQLKNLLESMSITNVSWSNVEEHQQALFIDCGDPNRVEDILEKLMSIGIGLKIVGTSVSLFPATVHIENVDDNKEDESLLNLQKETENKFLKSVKSRMIVAQVVETVRSNAVFTFDYCMLIILASMIACVGLIENSSVILVASMLISPLMGPILAGTFGITIQNSPLRNLGIRSECIGLSMCIICGFICGLIVGAIQLQGFTGYVDEWPTLEMKSRGMSRSLWVGVFIALPSGAGVALSVLGGNTGSLVGVAISASLLPPAVNAGMLWAFSLLTIIAPLENIALNNTTLSRSELGCLPFQDNDYEPVYSCNMAIEMGIMGAVSLLLTLINILCIFLVGVIMLKIKEVVPQTSSASSVEFWGSDLKVARDSYRTMKGPESAFLHQKFRNEWEKLKTNEIKENEKRDIDFERILQRMSNYNPYWTLPNNSPPVEENPTAHHTIHNLPYSKLFNYETIVPSPGIRMARPFSFPSYAESESPIKRRKSKKHKKTRFNIGGINKTKFTVTSVPESSLLKTSISEEVL